MNPLLYNQAITIADYLVNTNMEVVCFDTETTGFDTTSEIIEISAVDMKDNVLIDQLIRINNPLPEVIKKITHIDDQMLADKPMFLHVESTIKHIFNDNIWVAYNATFDVRMLLQDYALHYIKYSPQFFMVVDAMKLVTNVIQTVTNYGSFKWYKLEEARQYFNLPMPEGALHRAITDTKVMTSIIRHIANLPPMDYDNIEQIPF
jgi:DNA polymerase III epsilon subunit family exonuclease